LMTTLLPRKRNRLTHTHQENNEALVFLLCLRVVPGLQLFQELFVQTLLNEIVVLKYL